MEAPLTKTEAIADRDVDALTRALRAELANGEDNIPADLKKLKGWLVWKVTEINPTTGKFNKIPIYPRSRQNRHGEQGSKTDMANLGTWDEANAALNANQNIAGVGFAMLPPFGIVALDVDHCVENGKLRDDVVKLTECTYCEISPSGTGIRAFWLGAASDGKNHNSGFELFHSKGFVTITGNQVENVHFLCGNDLSSLDADMRGELEKLSHATGKVGTTERLKETSSSNEGACEIVLPKTITELRSALSFMRADDRDLWQRNGHRLKTLGETGRGLFMEWSATSDKFDPQDAARKWGSFKPTRTGYQAIFAEAQRMGWLNPMSHAARGVNSEPWGDFQCTNVGFPQTWKANVAGGDYDPVASLEQNIITLDALENPFDTLPHYVDMWIPHDEVTLLAGHGGGGKSYVALSIAVHVALGLPFGPLPTTQANVLFFSGEDGAIVLRQRLGKICRALKIDPLLLDGKLHLLDASDIDPALHREQRVTGNGAQRVVTETPLLDSLAKLVCKLDAGLVVIDNASDTYDDDEIKRVRVRAFVRSLRSSIARPGRAVLLLAHINKASASHGRTAGTEDYSGSTAWHNSVRSRLSLIPDGKSALTIEHAKANLGEKASPVRLEWHEGVPLVAGSFTSSGAEAAALADKARDDADMAALVTLIQEFDKRPELVTTSCQGSATVFKLLKGEPSFPKKTDSERLMRLLRKLESEGRIYRREVKTPNRKWKEVFTCLPEATNAPIRKEEQSQESTQVPAKQEVVCAH